MIRTLLLQESPDRLREQFGTTVTEPMGGFIGGEEYVVGD